MEYSPIVNEALWEGDIDEPERAPRTLMDRLLVTDAGLEGWESDTNERERALRTVVEELDAHQEPIPTEGSVHTSILYEYRKFRCRFWPKGEQDVPRSFTESTSAFTATNRLLSDSASAAFPCEPAERSTQGLSARQEPATSRSKSGHAIKKIKTSLRGMCHNLKTLLKTTSAKMSR